MIPTKQVIWELALDLVDARYLDIAKNSQDQWEDECADICGDIEDLSYNIEKLIKESL